MESEVEKLKNKYGHWGHHPDKLIEDWRYEVANGDTRRGYWEWVAAQLDET
jgi:hypothetical protein